MNADLDALMERARAMLDGRPDPDLEARIVRGEIRLRRLNEDLEYAAGYQAGYEAGRRAVEQEMTARWTPIVREIRAWAPRWKPYAERRARELEWAKPRAGDFTGRLSPSEYFGTTSQPAAVERHAA